MLLFLFSLLAFEVYRDMDNVSEALQQLTMRQQERNYYTSNVPSSKQRASSGKGGDRQGRNTDGKEERHTGPTKNKISEGQFGSPVYRKLALLKNIFSLGGNSGLGTWRQLT